MQQQIDTTCQTLHASIDTFERQACHTPQHARCDKTHAFTHTRMRASVDETSITGTTRVRRHRQLVKVTTSAAPKKQGKTAILSFTLHFYSATFCTFTARPPKKRSNTKNIALLQRFAMQVTVPRLTKAPDSASPCLR